MLIAFVFPAFIETVTFWDEWIEENNRLKLGLRLAKNVALVLIGFFGLIAGLYANIQQLSGNKL